MWTKEKILNDAAKFTFKHEWRINSPAAYKAASRQNLVKEATKFLKNKPRKIENAYRWTKDELYKEVSKYKYKEEWRIKSPGSYAAAYRQGLKKELSKLLKYKVRKETQAFKWTDDKILENSLKYQTPKDWREASVSAYNRAQKRGIFEKATEHMFKKVVPRGYYTRKRIISIARKYKFTKEFMQKDYNAYVWAKRAFTSKDKEIFGHLQKTKQPITKWTKENVLKDALKYKYKKDWRLHSGSAIVAASDRGWYEEATKHMELVGNQHHRCVYSIAVKNEKIIYIGLTYKFKKRIKDHLESERFLKIKKEYGHECLEIKQLTEYIDIKKAQKLEIKLIKTMKDRGYKILNIRKGGGTGGAEVKWSVDKIIEEAKKYSSRRVWQKRSGGSHAASLRIPGVYERATKHMKILRKRKWSDKELIEDANKYKSLKEWRLKSPRAYRAAYQHDDTLSFYYKVTEHMYRVIKPIWKNKSDVINDAKKYKTRSEWFKYSPGASQRAKKEGYYEEAVKHMKRSHNIWTDQEIIDDAKKYKNKKEWRKNNNKAYDAAARRGVFKEATKHMPNRKKPIKSLKSTLIHAKTQR